jgi:hypothetical protein
MWGRQVWHIGLHGRKRRTVQVGKTEALKYDVLMVKDPIWLQGFQRCV